MLKAVLASLSIAAVTVPVAAPAQKRDTAAAAIVANGSEQGLRIGKNNVSRPFGADLVDRLVLVGSYSVGGQRLYLVRGDTAGDCPSRYVVIVAQAKLAPTVGAPFGTCSRTAQTRLAGGTLIVSMPSTMAGTGAQLTRFAFTGGRMQQMSATAVAGTPGAFIEDGCRPASRVDAATQAATLAQFEAEFPAEYRDRKVLQEIDIDPEEMRTMVTALSCLAPWPAAEQRVPDVATPLFASKRHGPAAFAALDAVAHDANNDGNLRAVARSFAAEMSYRVDRRYAF